MDVEEGREYQKAIDYLCGLVKEGELKIGSKLPTERKLAETLSIGRNSTREALRILENMGMIVCRQGSGNYITGNMTQTISAVIEMMLLLKQVTREEVLTFRRDLEKAGSYYRENSGNYNRKAAHCAFHFSQFHCLDSAYGMRRRDGYFFRGPDEPGQYFSAGVFI